MLNNLYQVDGKGYMGLHYMYTKDSLEDFWLRSGHNPVTEKALTWMKDFETNARRPMDQIHEHCQWIHKGYERPSSVENRVSWIDKYGIKQFRHRLKWP